MHKHDDDNFLNSQDHFHKDLEATDNELKGVGYTAISLLTFFIAVVTGIVFLLL